MYPTMPERSTVAIISRFHKNGKGLKVGDIIEAENPMFLYHPVGKRIIGMPGDYVIRDPYLSPTSGGAPMPGIVPDDGTRQEPMMMQVPEGHVWAIGDNLSWSRDSRFYGPIPMALIRGKIIASVTGPFSWSMMSKPWLTNVDGDESLDAKMRLAQELDEARAARREKQRSSS
jgi:mitochondrial inner membrane protease subunit 1